MNFPKPTPLDQPLLSASDVDFHRNLGCPRYNNCLGLSTALGWVSFSCAACPLGSRRFIDDDAIREQAQRRFADR